MRRLFNLDNGFNPTTGRYVVSKTGIYGVFANVRCDGCDVPTFSLSVSINGNIGDATNGLLSVNGAFVGVSDVLNVGGYVELRAGDYIELYMYASSDTAWTVQVQTTFSAMMINQK